MRRGRRRALLVLTAGAATLVLSGCSSTVTMTPAPDATSATCASIIVAVPSQLGTANLRQTDAQGTAAWGDPDSVHLTCGVTPITGPSTLYCNEIDGVDWLEQDLDDGTIYNLVSYGRTPATQVVINGVEISSSDVMPPISDVIKQVQPTPSVTCTAPNITSGDATGSPTPTP